MSGEEEVNTFFEHYDIEKIVTLKCIAVTCNKLRGRRFMLKKIPDEVI